MMWLADHAGWSLAFAASAYAITASITPKFDRMLSAIRGEVQPLLMENVK